MVVALPAIEPDFLQVGSGKAGDLEAVVAAIGVELQLFDVLVVQGKGEGTDAVEQEVMAAGLQRERFVAFAAVDFLHVVAVAAVVEIGAVAVVPDDAVVTMAAVVVVAALVADQGVVAA